MRVFSIAFFTAALAAFGGRAEAADPGRATLFLEGGLAGLSNARDSAQAVFGGSSSGGVFGGGVRYEISRSWFVGASARVFDKTGERVFVADADAPVQPLGHPLEVKLVPIYAFAGYRFWPEARLAPYLAVGGGVTRYREESTIGGLTESQSLSKASGHLIAGAEYVRGRFGAGAEIVWSTVPSAIGIGGVSQVYRESDLGGFTFVARVSFGL